MKIPSTSWKKTNGNGQDLSEKSLLQILVLVVPGRKTHRTDSFVQVVRIIWILEKREKAMVRFSQQNIICLCRGTWYKNAAVFRKEAKV